MPLEELPPLERTATLTKDQELALWQRSQDLRRRQEAIATHTSQVPERRPRRRQSSIETAPDIT